MKTTSVHTHGHNDSYLRSVIPKSVTQEAGIKKGSVLNWDLIDQSTIVVKVISA